ncbi:hypothetical protein [Catelliglobosispora koreensis]|uniref:hypothetical protein n=1 Tax=Catelliglobosispora koreensis TaxID=129052 RepID=UPI000374C251|nr:hypothetical protein [Catelliglobosispora koreensis]
MTSPVTQKSRFAPLFGLLAIAAVIAVIFGVAFVGRYVRTAVIEFACQATACTATGMTTAGWLIVALPIATIAAGVLAFKRMSKLVKAAYFVLSVPIVVTSWTFVPGRGSSFSKLFKGPGSYQMSDGLLWGLAGLAGFVVCAVLVSFLKQESLAGRKTHLLCGAFATTMLAGLAIGIAQAAPTPYGAAEAFPEETWTASGDTLRRVSASDKAGCAGVLPVGGTGCVRTLHGVFTTDDSDAVVDFTAVLYTTDEDARAARDAIGSAAGRASEAVVVSAPNNWVVVGKVSHADNRDIVQAERGYLLWTLKQVTYRFLSVQHGLGVRPTPADGIGPKTP